jgi:hypothetical protein
VAASVNDMTRVCLRLSLMVSVINASSSLIEWKNVSLVR